MGLNQERGWVADQDSGECGLLPEVWVSAVQGLGVLRLEGRDMPVGVGEITFSAGES